MNEEAFLDNEAIAVLKATILKPYNEADQLQFIQTAQRRRLDPFSSQLYIKPEKNLMDKDGHYLKGIIMSGYLGFLTVADRSGVYTGSIWEWCGQDLAWKEMWVPSEAEPYPFAARVRVYRKDHIDSEGKQRPEVGIAKWRAKAAWTDKGLIGQWAKDPDFMLGKCALVAALRRAFPNELSGIYEPSELNDSVSVLETDVAAQEERIKASEAAAERLAKEGVKTAAHTDEAKPRDPRAEVEPPDDIPMGDNGPSAPYPPPKAAVPEPPKPPAPPAPPAPPTPPAPPAASEPAPKDPGWWRTHVLTTINHDAYRDKMVEVLTEHWLTSAVNGWMPKVEAAWDDPKRATAQVKLDYEAIKLAWEWFQANKKK